MATENQREKKAKKKARKAIYKKRKNIPRARDWFDMDFTKWKSSIARLQHCCSCRSGAHSGAALLFIFHTLRGDLDEILTKSVQDSKILSNVMDLSKYNQYRKALENENGIKAVRVVNTMKRLKARRNK